jgi:glycerophosphoryl diester phosphodiesterase
MMIVAHRGASHDAPENTMPAFELAWQQGADAIETDIHLTRDGQVVCIHDNNTQRVSGADMRICESTLADLKTLDMGAYYGKQFQNCAIPVLQDVLNTVPQKRKIYIEIKCGSEVIPALMRDLDASKLVPTQVVFISFHDQVLQELKQRAPQYKTLLLLDCSDRARYARDTSHHSVIRRLEMIQADGLSSSHHIPEAFIAMLLESRYEWHVWTVDDVETWARIVAFAPCSITTNRPGYMKYKEYKCE